MILEAATMSKDTSKEIVSRMRKEHDFAPVKFTVTGSTYEGRQGVLQEMVDNQANTTIHLEYDPRNRYDSNAIKVMASINGREPKQIGFVPAALASVLHRMAPRWTLPVSEWSMVSSGWYGRDKLMVNLSILFPRRLATGILKALGDRSITQ